MLLFDLINNDIFASGLSEFIVKDSRRDFHEKEHIQKDKHNEVDIVRLEILDS